MSAMPEILYTPTGQIMNFHELSQWAYYNDPLWCQALQTARYLRLNEEDTLRLLAMTQLKAQQDAREALLNYARQNSRPFTVEMPL